MSGVTQCATRPHSLQARPRCVQPCNTTPRIAEVTQCTTDARREHRREIKDAAAALFLISTVRGHISPEVYIDESAGGPSASRNSSKPLKACTHEIS
jgi:hypothetical protein